MSDKIINKKVDMNFDIDGNAFAIIAEFERAAFKANWSKQEIVQVVEEAKKGDYDHLLGTFLSYSK